MDPIDECLYYLKRYNVTSYNIIPSEGKVRFISNKSIGEFIIKQIDNVIIYEAELDNRIYVEIKK